MRLRYTLLAAVMAALTMLTGSPRASAYCYDAANLTWQRDGAPLEAIPVYLDFGAMGDLRRTGLDGPTLVRYTLALIEEVNRSAGVHPRLYFGGIREPAHLVTAGNLPDGAGIHIRAARCSDDDGGDDRSGGTADAARGPEGSNRARIRLTPLLADDGTLCSDFEPWNTEGAEQIGPNIPVCEEPYPGVFSPTKGYCIPNKDYKGVVLHEMMHALGLHHHQLDTCDCEARGGVHSDDPVPTYGSVRTYSGVGGGYTRTLFRDDIEGLTALYSSYSSWPSAWRVIEYESDDGLTWDAVGEVPLATRTLVPVAASSSTDASDSHLTLAYAEPGGRVRVTLRTPGGWSDQGPVSPTATVTRTDGRVVLSGVTVQPPATAYAAPNDAHAGRIGVAWIFEDETAQRAEIFWGVRARAGGAWTLSARGVAGREPIETDFRRVSMGYDPVNDRFLLSYLDDRPGDPRGYGYVLAIDPITGQVDPTGPDAVRVYGDPDEDVATGPPVPYVMHDIGAPVCRGFGGRASCTIPFSTSGPNGPCHGHFHGTRTADGLGFASLEREVFCRTSQGLHDLSGEPGGGTHVGSMVSWMSGADPIAASPPQSFNCGAEDLCAGSPLTEVRLRYRVQATEAGPGWVALPGAALDTELSDPRDYCFIPGTSASQPGPNAPGPWWPAAVGTRGDVHDTFRIFVTEVEQRCGNGVIEGDEECDGDAIGASCTDVGFGPGSVSCTSSCTLDTSECSLPGCTSGTPGEPGCECLDVISVGPCPLDQDGCVPDGPGSFGTASVGNDLSGQPGLYCTGDAVCGLQRIHGTLRSVCQACPSSPSGDAGYGCPCNSDSDCAPTGQAGPTTGNFSGPTVDLACWGANADGWMGTGTCLPAVPESGSILGVPSDEVEEFERTRWMCKASCDSIQEATNVAYGCLFNQSGFDLDYATCVELGGCDGLVTGVCEESGNRCSLSVPTMCIAECDPMANTGAGNAGCAAYGYPPGYMCTTSTAEPHCVPSACAGYPMVTDLSYCQQFMNGGV